MNLFSVSAFLFYLPSIRIEMGQLPTPILFPAKTRNEKSLLLLLHLCVSASLC